jgi:hypothetical protein
MALLLSALKERGVLALLMKEGSPGYARGTPPVHHCVKLAVFSLPAAGAGAGAGAADAGRVFRRVDLVVVPHEDKAAAILAWSGSLMFEKALKYFVNGRAPGQLSCTTEVQRSLEELETVGSPTWSTWAMRDPPTQRWHLSQSGLHAVECDATTSTVTKVVGTFKPAHERDVFRVLGLEYIPPTERNV